MKKLFFLAVATMTLAACTNEEEVLVDGGQKQIAFSAVNHNLTRSTPTSDPLKVSVFDENNVMYVSANYKNKEGDSYGTYFEGKTFKKVENEDWWGNFNGANHAPIYYPVVGWMEFMAYSAETAPKNNGITWNTTSHTCTVEWDALTGYDDVMYSNLLTGVTCNKSTDVQNFEFSHALAWLNYKVTTSVNDAVKIYDIRVNEASLNGTATFSFVTPTPTAPAVSWNTPAAAANSQVSVEFIGQNVGASNMTINATNGWAASKTTTTWGNGLLVPQQTEKSFTIYYTITNAGTESGMMEYTYTPATPITWIPGKNYIYNISITLNEIKVTGTVVAFDDVDAGSPEI